MSFIFDCRFIRIDHHDGISRFSTEIFSAVAEKTSVTALVCDVKQLEQLPFGVEYIMANDPKNPFKEMWLPRALNAAGASVVFSPMQTMGSLGKKYKLILTLHDLIYYKHRKPPGSLAWPIRVAWRLFHLSFHPVRLLLNRSDAVVTISETTKDMIRANRLTTKPINVISNASSMPHVATALQEFPSRNLLYMGSFMPYKNVELLVQALEQLTNFTLTLCSRITPQRKSELLVNSSESARSRIRFLNGVSDSQYQDLLDHSFALVTASKDEGFGIPVIESMSRSIPVILSDIPIFREVAGKAGNFFNASSVEEFESAVRKLESPEKWRIGSSNSLERAADFGWDHSAVELLRVVRSLRN